MQVQTFIHATPTIRLVGRALTRDVILNDRILDPYVSLKFVKHSLDGFSWGYGGSGPAQLALAVLLEIMPYHLALEYYHDFKFMVLSGLPGDQDFDVKIDIRDVFDRILYNRKNRAEV